MALVYTARQLVTSKQTANRSVRLQGSSFSRGGAFTLSNGNAREKRISVTFGAANAPKVIWHGLGFPPSGYQVLGQTGAGTVYNNFPLRSTSRVLVLMSDTANLVADVLVR